MLMLAVEFLSWWYGVGWRELAQRLLGRVRATAATFSVATLWRTLFAPWRRIVTPDDHSVAGGMRALLDNTISRLVGLSVRLIVILTAGVVMTLLGIIGAIALVAWPLLPIVSLGLIIRGVL